MAKRSVSDYDLTPTKGQNDKVNWGDVAFDFGKTLMDARQRKLDRQEAVKTEFQQSSEKLGNIPETDDLNVQAKLIKASQESMRTLSERYNMTKEGLISTEDFSIFQTNQRTQYKTTGSILKNIGAWTQQIQKKIDDQSATALDLQVYDYLQGYGGLKGHNIVSGKDGMIQIAKLKYKMTPAEAMKALTKLRQGSDYNYSMGDKDDKNKQGSDISDEDIKAYIEQNSGYGEEISKNRSDFIGVDQLAQLFQYQGDNTTIVDVGGAITDQVATLGEYVQSIVGSDGGITTISDYRNMPNSDGTGTAYDETLEDLQNTMTNTPNGIVQVLTTLGDKKLATSLFDMKEKYGDDAKTVDQGGDVIIMNMDNGVVSIVSDVQKLKDEANSEIEDDLNSKLDRQVKKTGPNAALLNYQLNKSKLDEGESDLQSIYTGIGNDLKAIVESDAKTGEAVSADRIVDINQRLLGTNVKITSIKRNGEFITITKQVTGQYGKVTTDTVDIDNSGETSQRDIMRKLYRQIVPQKILSDLAFDGFIKKLEGENGGGFEIMERTIPDPENKGETILNPLYKGIEDFTTANTAQSPEIPPYEIGNDADFGSDNPNATTGDLFDQISKDSGNLPEAVAAVDTALSRGLTGTDINYKVTSVDEWGGDNTIKIRYQSPSTNQFTTEVFIFNENSTSLKLQTEGFINSLIRKVNKKNADVIDENSSPD